MIKSYSSKANSRRGKRPMANKPTAQDKAKEEWLREDLRASRTQMLYLVQWGSTALAAVELNLYYIRQDVRKHLVEQHVMKPDQLLPIQRWILGTVFLSILAYVFSFYLHRLHRTHVGYRRQLIAMNPSYSGIHEDIPTGGRIGRVHYLLFFVFPLFDVFVWLLFYAGPRLHITIPW
jgi:hypothetical protein